MSAVLLSLRPPFAKRLLSGDKTAEIRRRFPNLPPGTVIYVYASTPIRAVIGTLRLDAVHTDTPAALWRRFGKRLDISEAYFNDYLEGKDSASVVELRPDQRWTSPVSLHELRERVGVEPPQSYRYLTPVHERLLRRSSPTDITLSR